MRPKARCSAAAHRGSLPTKTAPSASPSGRSWTTPTAPWASWIGKFENLSRLMVRATAVAAEFTGKPNLTVATPNLAGAWQHVLLTYDGAHTHPLPERRRNRARHDPAQHPGHRDRWSHRCGRHGLSGRPAGLSLCPERTRGQGPGGDGLVRCQPATDPVDRDGRNHLVCRRPGGVGGLLRIADPGRRRPGQCRRRTAGGRDLARDRRFAGAAAAQLHRHADRCRASTSA